jgi:hypothetical protein
MLFFLFQCPKNLKGSTRSCKSQEILLSFKLKRESSQQQQQHHSRMADDQQEVKSGDVATANAAAAVVCHVDACRDVVVFHKHQMSHHSLYEIPPPNYKYDPTRSREKLL